MSDPVLTTLGELSSAAGSLWEPRQIGGIHGLVLPGEAFAANVTVEFAPDRAVDPVVPTTAVELAREVHPDGDLAARQVLVDNAYSPAVTHEFVWLRLGGGLVRVTSSATAESLGEAARLMDTWLVERGGT
ncbi:MAG TPA: hypothetical protein VNQ73_18190 [Ilumatobacter sp.]|nr:hypothetical protein [Ilumatobacter sp.]